MDKLEIFSLKDIPLIEPGDDLNKLILDSIINTIEKLVNNDVVLIAQKIISKAENRYVILDSVKPSKDAIKLAQETKKDPRFVELIINNSEKIISSNDNVIVTKHNLGFINVNAGIDRSNIPNASEQVLLLPNNPSASAKVISDFLSNEFNVNIGVIITDTMSRPLRYGINNFAIGSYNIKTLNNLVGTKDIYGNDLIATEIGVADELAAASGLVMGQAAEMKPVSIIRGLNKVVKSNYKIDDLFVKESKDFYRQ